MPIKMIDMRVTAVTFAFIRPHPRVPKYGLVPGLPSNPKKLPKFGNAAKNEEVPSLYAYRGNLVVRCHSSMFLVSGFMDSCQIRNVVLPKGVLYAYRGNLVVRCLSSMFRVSAFILHRFMPN